MCHAAAHNGGGGDNKLDGTRGVRNSSCRPQGGRVDRVVISRPFVDVHARVGVNLIGLWHVVAVPCSLLCPSKPFLYSTDESCLVEYDASKSRDEFFIGLYY